MVGGVKTDKVLGTGIVLFFLLLPLTYANEQNIIIPLALAHRISHDKPFLLIDQSIHFN
jgi:hypothetical protein